MVYKYKSYVCCHKMAFFLQGTDKFFGKVSKQNKSGLCMNFSLWLPSSASTLFIRHINVIREGKATTRNAINLLQLIGFDQKIVDNAHEKARRYLKTGAWQ